MLLESGKVGASLGGVLSVDEGIVFLAILVGVCKHHFNVVALQMYDRVERLRCHVLLEQVEKSVAREVSFPVEENLKACVEVGVVVDHCLNKVQTELVVTEKSVVGKELHHSPVRLSGVGGWSMGHDVPFFKIYAHSFSVAHACHMAVCGECVYGFKADTVKADGFFEVLVIEFSAGVDFGGHLLYFSERNSSPVVAYGYFPFFGEFYVDSFPAPMLNSSMELSTTSFMST